MHKKYSLVSKQNALKSGREYCDFKNNINLYLIMITIILFGLILFYLIKHVYNNNNNINSENQQKIENQKIIKCGLFILVFLLLSAILYLIYIYFFINTDIGCDEFVLSNIKK